MRIRKLDHEQTEQGAYRYPTQVELTLLRQNRHGNHVLKASVEEQEEFRADILRISNAIYTNYNA